MTVRAGTHSETFSNYFASIRTVTPHCAQNNPAPPEYLIAWLICSDRFNKPTRSITSAMFSSARVTPRPPAGPGALRTFDEIDHPDGDRVRVKLSQERTGFAPAERGRKPYGR
jgi:hypothetical protein